MSEISTFYAANTDGEGEVRGGGKRGGGDRGTRSIVVDSVLCHVSSSYYMKHHIVRVMARFILP